MRFAGLATPRPRALIEMRRPGVGNAVAYLVVDRVEGVRLDRAVDPAGADPHLAAAISRMFGAWRELYFVHGDTKASHFAVVDGDVSILDLDAAAFHRREWRFARGHRLDRARFLGNWPESPAWLRDAVGEGA